ncbi:MAG: hypothetical protein GXO07_04555 [Crenarchaeota archaeon]|nr:hypothetical protein [Thermoproteota archaeon]
MAKHPASGTPLCAKHFLRYVRKRVVRNMYKLGIRDTYVDPSYGEVEAVIVRDALSERGIEVKIEKGRGMRVMSIDKVLYFLLKAFYEGDREALRLADPRESKNPAFSLLPYEVALYAKLTGLNPPRERFEGALWRIARAVALEQPTEAYSSLKIISQLSRVFPVLH